MTLIKWSPRNKEMERTPWAGNEMENLFENFFKELPNPFSLLRSGEMAKGYFPNFDLREEEGEYVVTADLPGVRKEELDISVTEDRVTLKGEHKEETQRTEMGYFHKERHYGAFERSIALPGNIRTEEVKASLHDGVLTLRLPQVETNRTKHIEITEITEQ